MLLQEIKNIKSTKRELRNFGLTLGIAFGLLGILFIWKGNPSYFYLFALSGFLLVFGIVFPVVLKPFQKLWMTIALIIGYIMTRVILCLLFYLIITPISLTSRIFGTKFLDIKIEKSKSSYWIERKQDTLDKEKYEKQY